MARSGLNLLELDVDKLFEDHKIDEIIEIEKLLDAEIERKRIELRSMVGDRYKDVLAASDTIKSMKAISQEIVDNIQTITDTCESLISDKTLDNVVKQTVPKEKGNEEERVLIIQIRLAIFLNEQIWIALDNGNNLLAAQFYLLAQHIHMGLNLTKPEFLAQLPLLKQIKFSLNTLKDQIFSKIQKTLELVEITAQETSKNLSALLLLQNQSIRELLEIFIRHRKIALNTVINTQHSSVRVQVSAMVRCLITTISLLHDCFMHWQDCGKGLIWQQLEEIIAETSPTTLSQIELPISPLIAYIPEIILQFRPKCNKMSEEPLKQKQILEDWLKSTQTSVDQGLENSLKLVVNIKGLHIIREEALKIELPNDWDTICSESSLPDNFNVWYNFFQKLVTNRARELISSKVASIMQTLESDIETILSPNSKLSQIEADLRRHTWLEDASDVSRTENSHNGLAMKTLGYSQNIVDLCGRFDSKYLELLTDVSQYLYGKEFDGDLHLNLPLAFGDAKNKRKFIDREELEEYLRIQCTNNSTLLTTFLVRFLTLEQDQGLAVSKALTCARFLQSITNLCPNYKKCCSFNNSSEDWNRVCGHFTKSSLQFWEKWIEKCVTSTGDLARRLTNISACEMISILHRWDVIEIQEQTEEKVFKSQIKVPLKPSLLLQDILNKLNDDISDILPHTLPKQIHYNYLERNIQEILNSYRILASKDLNQNQALQFLFDVKFLTTFCIPRENSGLVGNSQEICDILRARIDPFDLDVFYSYLQNNVKRAVMQSQVILGCLLPSSVQLANLGLSEGKTKDQEKEPSILPLSQPSVSAWFPLLPISVPTQKNTPNPSIPKDTSKSSAKTIKTTPKKSQDPAAMMRSSAAALFGGLTTDWFS